MSDILTIAILEDDAMANKGYVSDLSKDPQLHLIKTMRYGEELLPFLKNTQPQVLILDLSVRTSETNEMNYPVLFCIREIARLYPETEMIAISQHNERAFIESVLRAGVTSYFVKDDWEILNDLPELVRRAAKGELEWGEQAHKQLRKSPRNRKSAGILTPAQEKVLSYCAAYPHLSNKQVAKNLNLGYSNMRNLLSQAYLRLDVHNRTGAIAKIQKLHLVPREIVPPSLA